MQFLHWVLLIIPIVAGLATATHALLLKRDPRGAMGWIAVCLMFPYLGPIIYLMLGINRVETRARKLHSQSARSVRREPDSSVEGPLESPVDLPVEFSQLARISSAVTGRDLVQGNSVRVLYNGEQAYPAMLEAISKATKRVLLATYIYETNAIGRQFAEALSNATQRGVEVYVLLDGIGELYSGRRASRMLRDGGVRVARFLPPRILPPAIHLNLRNHRKILVADGIIAFTGGMNIGDCHMVTRTDSTHVLTDVHFGIQGPVASQIESVFIDDWRFVTGEELAPSNPAPKTLEGAICRTIVDGPNQDHDPLSMVLIGAISSAQRTVQIMTPYFLPSRELTGALIAAALRGVDVTVVLPERSNIPPVDWATRKILWEFLRCGVSICYQPKPFAHSKLFVLDQHYAQIGSANMDPRSLRLNFELAVEIYDARIASVLSRHIGDIVQKSRPATLEEVEARPLSAKIRDAVAWLASPYL